MMNTVRSLIATALFAFAASSEATIIAYDGFSYTTPGELNTQNGGTGWGSAWSAVTSATQIVDPAVNLVDNSALQITNNNGNVAYRSLASSFSGSQVFVDFYLQVDSGSLTGNDFLALWFDTITTGDHTNRPNFGIKADGSGTNDVFGRTKGTGGDFVTPSNIGSTNDVTNHIVGLLSKTVANGNFNRLEVWLNPLFGDLTNNSRAIYDEDSGISSFNKIGFRSVNLDSGDVVLIDNLRLSTTWNEALNIPEPATLALLGIGLAGIGLRSRK